MCFILALKKTFIYLYSACSYRVVYLDLDTTVLCLLVTTTAHTSACQAKLTSETQTSSIH